MRFGVLGTGMVGHELATGLVGLGHQVAMGARQAGNEKASAWAAAAGAAAREGSFADAAAFGEVVINATAGAASLEALAAAGEDNLSGKILIDVANPLDFSGGMPALTVCNRDSLGEQIQNAFPATRVVKTLNTINCEVMVAPELVPGDHVVFVSGNDAGAKAEVAGLLGSFGWPEDSVFDLGDISTARGTEMYLMLWIHMRGIFDSSHFNIAVSRASGSS